MHRSRGRQRAHNFGCDRPNGGTIKVQTSLALPQDKMVFRKLYNVRFSPNLAATRESISLRRFSEGIFENFPFMGYLPPKPQNWWVKQVPYSDQPTAQGPGDTMQKDCSLHVVVQGPGSSEIWSSFFCTTYGYRATGHQIFPILSLWLFFSYTKSLKSTPPVTSLQPIAECFRWFHVMSYGKVQRGNFC